MDCAAIYTEDRPSSPAISARIADIPAKARSLDGQIVEAFRGMESVVNDAFHAGELFRNTINGHFGASHPVNGKHDFEMSPVEWETMFFAMYQLLDLVGGVRNRYYAAYEDVPTSGSA